MDHHDQIARILASLAALPAHEQADAVASLISSALREIPTERVLQIRGEIVLELDNSLPVVRHTLDLIDGHLALRDMGLVERPEERGDYPGQEKAA